MKNWLGWKKYKQMWKNLVIFDIYNLQKEKNKIQQNWNG